MVETQVRKLRLEKGLSQEQLAEKAKVSFCIDMTVSSEELESTYLFAFLNSKWIRNKLENKVRSYRTTPISKKDIEEIKIPILTKKQQKLIGKLYLNVMEKEKIWKRMIENEKDTIETIILKKGGFFE